MSVRQVFTSEQPVLRQKAKKVKKVDALTQKLIDDMVETMQAAPGLGLAAPQVGVALRVIVIETAEREDSGDGHAPLVQLQLVNPEIVKSDGEQISEEGCLSIPGYVGVVKRAMNVTVKALDRKGKQVKVKATAQLARVIQHEIDHLDGILFTDRIESPGLLYRLGPNRERIPVFQAKRALAQVMN